MDDGDFREEAWPELTEHWFFRRIVMHNVPRRYLGWHRWGRLSLSISHCGKICRPPLDTRGFEITWCDQCFPKGPPNRDRVDL